MSSTQPSVDGRRPLRRDPVRLVGFALASVLLVSACGEDDKDGAPTASVSGTSSGEATCSPVGEHLAARADSTVEVTLSDFAFDPSSLQVGAGVVTFAATNTGSENHELAFLPGGGEVPLNDGGAPDEDALAEAGAFELEAFGPGQDCQATYDLQPGSYTVFCIVESTDGRTHYEKGMRGQLVVQ